PHMSRVDRHEQLGEGFIDTVCFRWIMNQKFAHGIPLILETPDPDRWAGEIALLRSFIQE
ncbi:MAG TPA: deoxyribonuclease IV, partial [bacterium]|nr:deoxyribonuclease IV [bacterium]